MYATKAGAKIRFQKDRIIKMQKEGARILDIAKEYNVTESSMYKYFKRWGVRVIRSSKYKSREYGDKQKNMKKKKGNKKREHWHREFSKAFIENRAAMTKKYGDKIKYPKGVSGLGYKKLIRGVV